MTDFNQLIVAPQESASLEERKIELLDSIVLDSLLSAKDSSISTRAYDIRLFTRIECLRFKPLRNYQDNIPEELYDLKEQARMNGASSELFKKR